MHFTIYGSCVTRDIFSILNLDEMVANYRARCSIHSYTSPPITESNIPDLSQIVSKFQQRMVQMDFTKPPVPGGPHLPIIVDFIDERFNVLKFLNSLVTASKEFNHIATNDKRFIKAFTRGEGEEEEFRSACSRFRSMHLNTPIILHCARYATQGKVNGKIVQLENQERIKNMNANLKMYERIFIEEVSPIGTIKVPSELKIANSEHIWGLAPFHYIDEYYEEALSQLKKLNQQ